MRTQPVSGHPGGVRTKAIAGNHDRSQSGLQHFLCTRFLGRPTLDLSKSSGWDTGGYVTLPQLGAAQRGGSQSWQTGRTWTTSGYIWKQNIWAPCLPIVRLHVN